MKSLKERVRCNEAGRKSVGTAAGRETRRDRAAKGETQRAMILLIQTLGSELRNSETHRYGNQTRGNCDIAETTTGKTNLNWPRNEVASYTQTWLMTVSGSRMRKTEEDMHRAVGRPAEEEDPHNHKPPAHRPNINISTEVALGQAR